MMRLAVLLHPYLTFPLPKAMDRFVYGLKLDSRLVQVGDIFIVIPAVQTLSQQYIKEALLKGAVAVLIEASFAKNALPYWEQGIPIIPMMQLQHDYKQLAARFHHDPMKKLRIIGVTGTNGKTSCSYFFASMLRFLGIRCGIIGTLGSGLYQPTQPIPLTTPDPITLQAILQALWKQAANTVIMEVSSHGIAQQRIENIPFELALFTNLTQDHLDYHGNMQCYAAVKKSFLFSSMTQAAVLNIDDPYGYRWLIELAQHKPVFAYSLKPIGDIISAEIPRAFAINVRAMDWQVKAYIVSTWGEGEIQLPLIGTFNLSNVLAALVALCARGMAFETVLHALSALKTVPGRMQMLGGEGQDPCVVIDYAHTPDALKQVLQVLRQHCMGQLICIFGCGGNRDRQKRPQMAAIAEALADQVIITNDNPRDEDPNAIAADIVRGFRSKQHIIVELNRKKAIREAIYRAQSDDCILIAGKGHECYQEINGCLFPFSDIETVALLLQ